MRILLLASAFNSLTQRVQAELSDHGHSPVFALADSAETMRGAVRRHAPDLVLAPMLKTPVPEDIWRRRTCLIVHPGPPGDRGPSALDWALHEGHERWGVTVLQAVEEMDAGPIWAHETRALPAAPKSDLYRGEIADAAITAVLRAVERYASGTYRPPEQTGLTVRLRPYMQQKLRQVDWASDTTADVLRTLRAADSQPGVLDDLMEEEWYLHGGHSEDKLRGRPGEIIATRAQAVCRATTDGAVWIPQLRRRRTPDGAPGIKLPATVALGEKLPDVPEQPAPLWLPTPRTTGRQHGTYRDINYEERGGTGFLRFSFPSGAMSTCQCRRLLAAYRFACNRPTRVLVLGPERDFFSNGIHLNVIEAAHDPSDESWANIQAMNDLVEAVLTTTDRLVVASLPGNAAAGGVMLALAADEVWCRTGTVLNPHYLLLGLTGSEYWTYTLPGRVGIDQAREFLTTARPISAASAARTGLVDHVEDCTPGTFAERIASFAQCLASDPALARRIAAKRATRERDEAAHPLAAYRKQELTRMGRTFDDPRAPYHALRRAFVRKLPGPPAPRTDGLNQLLTEAMGVSDLGLSR